jgi:hypothetical protein
VAGYDITGRKSFEFGKWDTQPGGGDDNDQGMFLDFALHIRKLHDTQPLDAISQALFRFGLVL